VARHAFTDYTKEKNSFEVNKSLISPGDRVLIVDDWSETGGQLKGLIGLLKKRGAVIAGISLLGFNQIRRTRHLEKNYKLRAIIEHTIEGERDLTKPLA
jgi:adenine/guanine phosphoribosyltransferase-like PRPP-binding protein